MILTEKEGIVPTPGQAELQKKKVSKKKLARQRMRGGGGGGIE